MEMTGTSLRLVPRPVILRAAEENLTVRTKFFVTLRMTGVTLRMRGVAPRSAQTDGQQRFWLCDKK